MSDNMGDLFKPSNIKIGRAEQHLVELGAVLAKHDTESPTQFSFTPASEGQGAHLHVKAFSPPLAFSAIVGDVVHNLRAALDLMAVELVGLTPNGNTKGVYFPFCESASDLDQIIKSKKFHRAGADAVAILKGLKPYVGGNLALRALHDLDICDKHHTLIPNSALIETPKLMADPSDFPNITIKLVEGTQPKVALTFPEDYPLAGSEIIPTLHELVKLVKGILESFTSLIASRA